MSWTIWTYKVTGSSTWGLYNVYGDKVDIYTDTAEEIEAKWRDQGLLRRNTPICQVVANAIAGGEVALPEDPADLSAVPVQALSFASVTATEGASVQTEGDGFRLTEIRIGEWNSGDYLFDRFWLCCGAADELTGDIP